MMKKLLVCTILLIAPINATEPTDDGEGARVTIHTSATEDPFPGNSDQTPAHHIVEIQSERNKEIKKWGRSLMRSQRLWYRAGNIAEGLSQLCYVAAPILSFVGTQDSNSATAAGILGVCGLGLQKFSKYAHGESAERGDAANQFLKAAGVDEIPVIKQRRASSVV